jgi:CRISPR/Cas system CMR subunit Cmr6 (Cas7 group RAMP superfamily)
VLNHSATNKTDRENTTTTNNLTTVSTQNRPQQSSSKEELLDAHFMAKKVQKQDQDLPKPIFFMSVCECFSRRTYRVSINIKNDKRWNQHCRPKHGEVVLET